MQTPSRPDRPPTTGALAPSDSPHRAHWWSSNRTQALAVLAGAVLLETVPVSAWLQTLAAVSAADPARAALPLWYLVAVLLVSTGLGRALRPGGAGATVLLGAPLLLVFEAFALPISPAAYGTAGGGPLDVGWLGQLGADLASGSDRVSAAFLMLFLLGYVEWRGLRLGRSTASVESLLTTFKYGLASVILAAIVGAAAHGPARVQLAERLALLLPLLLFAGLVALTVTRARAERDASGNEIWSARRDDRPWLALALVLAGGMVGAVWLLSLIVSYGSLTAALVALGPVGVALNAGIAWLIDGFVFLLGFVLGGVVDTLTGLVTKRGHVTIPRPPPPPPNACSTPNCAPGNLPPAHGLAVTIFLTLVAVAIFALLVYFLYRYLLRVQVRDRGLEGDAEERESLDGRALLSAQVRGLLARFGRGAPAEREDALPAGSVRRIYRDVLRMAASVSLGRRSSETPDEYAQRLGTALADQGGGGRSSATPAAGQATDLAALTEAYDSVRYGEDEPDGAALRGLRARGERTEGQLRTLGRAMRR